MYEFKNHKSRLSRKIKYFAAKDSCLFNKFCVLITIIINFTNFTDIIDLASLNSGALAQANESQASSEEPRKFNDVLGDLLDEYAYDLKTTVNLGIQLLSIRKITLTENIPKSYESYLESLLVEKTRKNSTYKIIQCTKCKVKKTTVSKGRLTVTIPINDPIELDAMAKQLGINAWIDAGLIFQETAIILAINIFDSQTKELLWTKVYNSEDLLKKRAQTKSDDPANPATPGGPTPEVVKKGNFGGTLGVGYYLVPNVKTISGMLGLNLRVYEKFQEQKSNIGAQLTLVADPALLIKDYGGIEGDPSQSAEFKTEKGTEKLKPYRIAVSVQTVYGFNFKETAESLDDIRYGITIGVGFLASSGYLTFLGALGGNLKLGKHFIMDASVMYGAPTTLTIKKTYTFRTKGGAGASATFGYLF